MISLCSGKEKSIQQPIAVLSATNTAPVEITTPSAHGFETGDIVQISGVAGNSGANGHFTIMVTGATSFTLNNSTGKGGYTAGGVVVHIGFSVSPVSVSLAPFADAGNSPYFSLAVQLEKLSAGAGFRAHWKDGSDANLLTALPGPTVGAVGPISQPTVHSISFPQFPVLQLGQMGEQYLGLSVYLTGGAGASCKFSSWVA